MEEKCTKCGAMCSCETGVCKCSAEPCACAKEDGSCGCSCECEACETPATEAVEETVPVAEEPAA